MSRNKRHLVEWSDGQVSIIQCNSEDDDLIHDLQIQKTLFELSRAVPRMTTHFDPSVHTFVALENGIPGHIPITQTEIDVSQIPVDRSQRRLWRFVNGQIVPVEP